ncbi:hypothetical protein E1A91_D01G179300v1 [Gossypium mustelinum]|uniref:Uncharacterized protein n=1 Tax=Gossypium mustelinum TaxID=34275 RepID=A0A5D2W8W3_GOSMU|nr:hypothetical protein E1A91_D01G179300v1 [Gossypium mustelinum]
MVHMESMTLKTFMLQFVFLWAMSSLTLKGKASDQAPGLANIQAAQKRPVSQPGFPLKEWWGPTNGGVIGWPPC